MVSFMSQPSGMKRRGKPPQCVDDFPIQKLRFGFQPRWKTGVALNLSIQILINYHQVPVPHAHSSHMNT